MTFDQWWTTLNTEDLGWPPKVVAHMAWNAAWKDHASLSEPRAEGGTMVPEPIHDPMGKDGHHSEAPFNSQDDLIADKLAFHMGTLFSDVEGEHSRYWYFERTSVDEWRRVAKALRIHGLRIVRSDMNERQDG